MIVFDIPKVILQFWEKVKIFNLLGPDLVWCLWTLYVCSWDMGYAVWTWKMSCCWRRIHVLYVQYMYCMYSTCTVCTAHIFFSNNKTSSMSIQHIPSSKSIYHVPRTYTMSQEHTYRVHRHQTRPGPKKMKIFTFSWNWRMTFGMSNTIITDSF